MDAAATTGKCGFVLVGGHGLRMGRDKARLRVNSGLLVEEVAAVITQVTGSVALVGRPEDFKDLMIERLPDLRTGCGPLAGLEAALASGRGEFNMVAGCDMPGLQPHWLVRLLITAEQTGALCVVARDLSGRIHPLCAVYRSACLPFVRGALDAGQLRVLELVRSLNCVEMPVDGTITNLNTPEQLANWQAHPIPEQHG